MNVLSQSLKLSPIRVPIKENLIRVEFSKIYNPKSDSNKKFRSLNKRLKPSGPLAIDLLVNGESQIVIIGDAGSGKTTLLQYLAWKKSSDNELLPLFLSLKKIDVELSRTNEIFDCILNSLTLHKTGMAKNNLKELIKAEINCKKVLWLLDGADEITIHKQEIKEFTDNLFLEGYSIVLSSRQFENQNPNINPEIYNTCSLEPKDINEFLRKFYTEAAESLEISESQKWISRKINHIIEKIGLNPAFFLFCKKPLILAILAILGLELSPNEKFPRTEREFFKIYIERIVTNNELERRENQRDQILPEITDSKITKEILLWGFYKISLTLFLEIKTKKINQLISVIKQILSDELIQILKIDQFRACATAEAIIEFWRLTGLFEINNIPNQETLNSVFSVIEEYGAAIGFLNECKKDEPTLWEIIKLNSHNIEFCCVIAMTIAELKDSNYIFRQLLIEEERNNSNHCPILIASRALAEGAVTTKEIKKEVISKLRNITTAHHRSSIASLAEMHLAMMHEVETLKEISLDKNVIRKVRIVAADYLFFLGESSASLTSLLSMGTPGLGSSRGTDPLIRNYGNSILYAYSLLYPEIDSPLDESFEYSESFSLPPEKNQEEVIDIILALGDNPYLDFGLAQRIVSIFGAMKQVDALLQFSKKAKGKNCLIAIAEELWKLGHIDEAIEIWVSVLTDCNRSLYEQEKAANGILEYPSRLNSSQIRIIKLIDKKSFHYRIIEKINNIIQCATDNDKKPII